MRKSKQSPKYQDWYIVHTRAVIGPFESCDEARKYRNAYCSRIKTRTGTRVAQILPAL